MRDRTPSQEPPTPVLVLPQTSLLSHPPSEAPVLELMKVKGKVSWEGALRLTNFEGCLPHYTPHDASTQ